MKITIKNIQKSSSPIELFKSGCQTEATLKEYTIMLKKFVNEFLEDILQSQGYEARVNEFVLRAKKDPEWIKKIIYSECPKKPEILKQQGAEIAVFDVSGVKLRREFVEWLKLQGFWK